MDALPEKALAILRTPWPLMGAWLIGGILSVIVPVSVWKKERKSYYDYYGHYVEYENNQRAYEEAQREYEEAQNGNYNNNNNQYASYNCKWYQVQCRKNAYNYQWYQENNDNNNVRLPDWYIALGGSMGDDERRQREEMGLDPDEASGALKFVYVTMILMFVGILLYGCYVMYKRQSTSSLIVATAMFGLSAFLQMIIMPQGVLGGDGGRGMEDSVYGWYGQLGVLMMYTNWAYFWFCLVSCAIFGIIAFFEYKSTGRDSRANQSASISSKELGEDNYKSMA